MPLETCLIAINELFLEDDVNNLLIIDYIWNQNYNEFVGFLLREVHTHGTWICDYSDMQFYRFFRMTRSTFSELLPVILQNDEYRFLSRTYPGGNFPVECDKCLLIFLYYMAHEDCLNSIGTRFKVADSTVMQICNNILFIVLSLKNRYIFWPKTEEEFNYICQGFRDYPGVIGAIDGCHINIKVPAEQHDSYTDRYMQHSINLMGVCTSSKIFTYIFVGFPGAAHDARVFTNSELYLSIERGGKHHFFPRDEYHIIGDEAFPLKTWLLKPYRRRPNMRLQERIHNKKLSASRVCIENTFAILKSRWRRLKYVNTYSVSKANEIVACACVLHNYLYMNNDIWQEELEVEELDEEEYYVDDGADRREAALARQKRDQIAGRLN